MPWYYLGYHWSADKRVRKHMNKEMETLMNMETAECYTKMGRYVLQLTIDAHPFQAMGLKKVIKDNAQCEKWGRTYERNALASDNIKLKEEYEMIHRKFSSTN